MAQRSIGPLLPRRSGASFITNFGKRFIANFTEGAPLPHRMGLNGRGRIPVLSRNWRQPTKERLHRDGLDGARGSRRARGGRAARSNARSVSGGLRSADFRAAGVRRPNLATCPSARPNLSPGYFLLIGDAPIPQDDGIVRLYWHLTPEGAARWLQSATAALNARTLPFHLKVLHSPHLFTRCDAGVLYLRQSAFVAAKPALRDIYAHVEAELRSEVPAFTKSLAPGIGLANRRRREFRRAPVTLIADGLIRSRTEGRTDAAGRLHCVLACWADF